MSFPDGTVYLHNPPSPSLLIPGSSQECYKAITPRFDLSISLFYHKQILFARRFEILQGVIGLAQSPAEFCRENKTQKFQPISASEFFRVLQDTGKAAELSTILNLSL